ncbi:MAG: cation:proton antiporter [Gammaproteobacteria bacterium]|nr:cation:proton antiporter [Gammaproteobacteria bacterium]
MLTVTIWLSFAFALGLGVRLIGLPPLVGYLAAGFILSAMGHESNIILKEVSHAGVLLLLFSVGLKLRLQSLVRIEVLAGSLIHMLITVGLLYLLLVTVLKMDSQISLMVSIILSFSSTVVAAKVLESKRELRAFHGRVAIGILIMQDLVAVAILSVGNGVMPSPWAFLLLGLIFLRPLFHRLLDISGHGELVILFGLLAALVIGGHGFEYFGLSSELGALLLGIMLATHKRSVELSNSIWGLKEILLVGFFLQIGLIGHPTLEMLQQALLINFLVPLKALLFFFILIMLRLRARTSFLTSLTLATYSEFGLIVASIGVNNGWISNEWMVMLALAVAISFAVSAPLNRYAHEIYSLFEKFLYRFESVKRHPDDEPINIGNSHIMVMGMGRVGTGAYDLLVQQHERVIGLDSDPIKVEQHRQKSRRVLYADAEDPGLWSNIQLGRVHTVMLAMPEISAKVFSTKQLRRIGFTGTITSTVVFDEEVKQLKKAGADLVYNYYDGVGTSFALNTLAQLQGYNEQ